MYKEFLNKLRDTYNYDDDLMNAIEITIPIMVDTYGDSEIDEILNLFLNVRIFVVDDMQKENRNKIENYMVEGINNNIISEDSNPYDSKIDPGAYYSYEMIFDENNNVKGEVRWLVTKRDDKYKELFGTSINMPYFLHELNHAFAMQNPVYKTNGNKIVSKHGMFSEIKEFVPTLNNKISLKDLSDEDIILEEMINEMYTQRQLIKLLKKNDYNEVREELKKVNHVPTSYSSLLITFAENMEKLIGRERLLEYRLNNDTNIKDEFNDLCSKSEIYKKYLDNQNPWEFFSKKCFEIFKLSSEGFKVKHSDYIDKQTSLMIEAFSVLCSYRDVKEGTINLQEFEKKVVDITLANNQIKNDSKKI